MPQESAYYTHGHHASVLRSHSQRTAANSAGHMLSYLRPNMHILDIGCGPGTITVDFAALVPEGRVTAIDYVPDVLEQARALATERDLANVEFMVGDVHSLNFPNATFDVVHAH